MQNNIKEKKSGYFIGTEDYFHSYRLSSVIVKYAESLSKSKNMKIFQISQIKVGEGMLMTVRTEVSSEDISKAIDELNPSYDKFHNLLFISKVNIINDLISLSNMFSNYFKIEAYYIFTEKNMKAINYDKMISLISNEDIIFKMKNEGLYTYIDREDQLYKRMTEGDLNVNALILKLKEKLEKHYKL